MENEGQKYQFSGTGLKDEQISFGQTRFNEYITSFPHLGTSGNAPLLEDLVWLEVMFEWTKRRLSEILNTSIMKGSPVKDTKDTVSTRLHDDLESYRNDIITLKTKLNMFDDPKVKDTFSQLEELFAKHEEYRESHIDDFLAKCPHCAGEFIMMCRTKDYEPVKTPFYEDSLILNKPLMDFYHHGLLTKEQMAKILGVNPRFIDWLDAKFYGIKHQDDGGDNFEGPASQESAPLNTDESAPTNQ